MRPTAHRSMMSQREEPRDSLDDFPTPPWATRALMKHVLGGDTACAEMTVLEPACGRGHMAQTLGEYFGTVRASDIHDYGFGEIADFLASDPVSERPDWIITNPPFRLGEAFVHKALNVATTGVAMLTRTTFLESCGRHESIFEPRPPSIVAPFAERVPMFKGRLDAKGSTATAYCWIVWDIGAEGPTRLSWIPRCRRSLERPGDYDEGSPGEVAATAQVPLLL